MGVGLIYTVQPNSGVQEQAWLILIFTLFGILPFQVYLLYVVLTTYVYIVNYS